MVPKVSAPLGADWRPGALLAVSARPRVDWLVSQAVAHGELETHVSCALPEEIASLMQLAEMDQAVHDARHGRPRKFETLPPAQHAWVTDALADITGTLVERLARVQLVLHDSALAAVGTAPDVTTSGWADRAVSLATTWPDDSRYVLRAVYWLARSWDFLGASIFLERLTKAQGSGDRLTHYGAAALLSAAWRVGDAAGSLATVDGLGITQSLSLEPNNHDATMLRLEMQRALLADGRPDQAMILAESSLVASATAPDLANWLVTQEHAAACLFGLDRFDEGSALLEQAQLQATATAQSSPDTTTSNRLVLHAQYLHAAGCYTGGADHLALDLVERLIAHQSERVGERDPMTLRSRHLQAQSLARSGAHDRATRLRQQLLADQAAVLGHDHPKTAHTRACLADTAQPGSTRWSRWRDGDVSRGGQRQQGPSGATSKVNR